MTEKEAIENLKELAVPAHAEPAFDMAIDALEKIRPKFHLKCLRCGGDVGCYSDITMEQVRYTNYSYCEECLREGLKMLKAHKDEMTEDTAKAIEIIQPIAKELGIHVTATKRFVYMNGHRIGVECNSTYATLMEMIGYIFLIEYPRFRQVKIKRKLADAITRFWYPKVEEEENEEK